MRSRGGQERSEKQARHDARRRQQVGHGRLSMGVSTGLRERCSSKKAVAAGWVWWAAVARPSCNQFSVGSFDVRLDPWLCLPSSQPTLGFTTATRCPDTSVAPSSTTRLLLQQNRLQSTNCCRNDPANPLPAFVAMCRTCIRPPDIASGGRGARSAQRYSTRRVVFVEIL